MILPQTFYKLSGLLLGIITVAGLIPVILYWFTIGRAPSLDVSAAKSLLSTAQSDTMLVDIRPPDEFWSRHLETAVNWPYNTISAVKNTDQIPPQLRDKTLLLICDSGILSAFAARKIAGMTSSPVYSVTGGLRRWIKPDQDLCSLALFKFITSRSESGELPLRSMFVFLQWAVVITAFGIKPLYMLVSLIYAIVLRREKSADMVALRWAFISFFLGEGFCAVNYLFFQEDGYLVEYLHAFGMALAFGFTTYALMVGFDKRIVKYRDQTKRCAALEFCGECYKCRPVNCNMKEVFLFIIPLMMAFCFMPLVSVPHSESYNVNILGSPYNYSHPVAFQIYEIYYAPAAAPALFMPAFFILLKTPAAISDTAEILFSAGMGFLGFSMLRFVIFTAHRDSLWWASNWEEFTETLFMIGAGWFLWKFRRWLFRRNEPVKDEPDGVSARV